MTKALVKPLLLLITLSTLSTTTYSNTYYCENYNQDKLVQCSQYKIDDEKKLKILKRICLQANRSKTHSSKFNEGKCNPTKAVSKCVAGPTTTNFF